MWEHERIGVFDFMLFHWHTRLPIEAIEEFTNSIEKLKEYIYLLLLYLLQTSVFAMVVGKKDQKLPGKYHLKFPV